MEDRDMAIASIDAISKSQLFEALAFAGADELAALEGKISSVHTVEILRAPARTLVMLKFRESARSTLFYAAEALACECLVAVDGTRGFATLLGEDLAKVRAMAVIDAALNAKSPLSGEIASALAAWREQTELARQRDARLAQTTKVDFNVME